MAAAIPATNKWLLTKQASVALSGLWDDRHREERRGVKTGGTKGRLNSGPLHLRWANQAQITRDGPLVKSGGHTHKEPSGDRKQEENERKKGGEGHWRCGEASGMERWVQLHGVCRVQWASCPLFFHLWALCQIQSTWLSSFCNHLTALTPSSSLSPSITTSPPFPSLSLSFSLFISLVAV